MCSAHILYVCFTALCYTLVVICSVSGSGWGSGADTEPAEPGIAIPLMNGHYIRSLDYGISFEDPLLNQVCVCFAWWQCGCLRVSIPLLLLIAALSLKLSPLTCTRAPDWHCSSVGDEQPCTLFDSVFISVSRPLILLSHSVVLCDQLCLCLLVSAVVTGGVHGVTADAPRHFNQV